MKAYTYLNNVRKYDYIIKDLELQRIELRTMAEKTTAGNLDGMPRGSEVSDKVGNLSAKLTDATKELNRAMIRYIDYKRDVMDMISKLDAKQYRVLHDRYILYKPFLQIADEMHYSRQQIWRIHGDALDALNVLLDSRTC